MKMINKIIFSLLQAFFKPQKNSSLFSINKKKANQNIDTPCIFF